MSRPLSIDWNRIILDLSMRGYSLRMIAVEIGDIHHSTVDDWKNLGAEPRYGHGKALITLWCDVMQKRESDLPANLCA